MTVATPTLTIRIARPFVQPVALGQSVTFRSNGWQFTGSVVAITAPRDLPTGSAVDVTLEGSA